tara:strand:- start:937 stop:1149 length:213 start_codon:yes stop_codon:yes gene_type:complete
LEVVNLPILILVRDDKPISVLPLSTNVVITILLREDTPGVQIFKSVTNQRVSKIRVGSQRNVYFCIVVNL